MASRTQIAALFSVAGAALLIQFAPSYSLSASYVWTFVGLFSLQLFAIFTWSAVLYPKLFSPLRHLPQPRDSNFFMGQFFKILKDPSGIPMQRWINEIPNEGLIRYTHIFNIERLLITSPKALGEVMVQKNYEFIKPAQLREGLGQILGVGILLAEGEEHKAQRKHLMPAFAYRHTKDLYPTFWSKSGELVSALTSLIQTEVAKSEEKKSAPQSSVVEIDGWLSRATLDIIGVAGLGHDFDAIHNPDTELNQTYRSIFSPTKQAKMLGFASLFIPAVIIKRLPVKRNDDILSASGFIRKVCRELIQEKQRKLNQKVGSVEVDILSVALESGGFSEDNLVDQLMTFLAAGHETTATAMTWAICLLCQHPEIQTRLREEIQAKLPSIADESVPMTAEALDRLPYLHAICNEVLRVHSPVPLTRRIASKDTSILGQFVPKGTDVILSPYAVNMSTALWGEDAMQFNPDRWMGAGRANSGGADSNYSFLTFLHGPRSCIGQAFAKAEFACLLAAVVGRFDMELAEKDKPIEIGGGITARPKGGLKIRMKVLEGGW